MAADLVYSKMLALPNGIASRRSHLDSVTYRTLVQLLSLNLDGGENPKSEIQNSEISRKSNSDDGINKGQFGLVNGCNNNMEATNQEKVVDLEKLTTVTAQNGSSAYGKEVSRQAENDSVIDSGELCNERIGEGEQQETVSFSDPFAECSGMKKLKDGKNVDKDFEDDKVSGKGLKDLSTVEAQNGDSEFVEVLDTENELEQGINIDQLKHDNELSKNIREIEDRMQHDSYVYSDPLVESFEKKSLIDNKGGEDFEEGEISGEDVELADEYVKMVHENSKFEDDIESKCFSKNRSTCPPKSTCSDMNDVDMQSCRVENDKSVHVKTVDVANDINLNSIENEEVKLSVTKEENGRVKRKRAPLTEGRKAKRKMAKKRQKAKKEREQGVKRLKLQPIVKPKVVKYCNFYLAGRCQQGDACKFSHDTTPLTKSQPCKFFACGTCLKGDDDCPFDHQLSKYPCHNHTSKGMCPRGDSCKFSHKLSVIEDTSPASIGSKNDPSSSSGKQNLAKHLSTNINQSQSNAVSSPQSIAHKPMVINAPKIPTQIPNGVQFLSIGERCSQQKQDKSVLLSQSEKIKMLQRMQVRGTVNNSEVGKKPNADKRFDEAASTAPEAVGERTTPTEVTEASKILEEFLFCGTC